MSRLQRLQERLSEAFSPQHLEVLDESRNHSGPAGETHYKVVMVSDAFAGIRAVARHQRVYAAVSDEMAQGLHALALHLYTQSEWQLAGSAPESPACRGGSRHG